MNLRKLGVDSMAVAVALAVGGGLGYIVGYVQFDEFRQDAADRMFFVNGKWVEPAEYEKMVWGKRILGNDDGSGTDDSRGIVTGELERYRVPGTQ